ncbi:MAG: bifunctional diguanylate cyclase/phosphodiesterase [Pseudomonadota bacterium]|nr:bifunctional diguanylate cyclase/phosphodiesterase [Pseudomonadota bacterium]
MMNWNPALPVAHGNPEALVMALMTEQRLDVHFQAILDMTGGAVLGYEALVRCAPDSPFDGPEALFRAASAGERLEELNSHCLALALARFQALDLPGKLFLNTTPDSLLLVGELLAGTALAMQPGRVVLEVSEKYPFRDIAAIGERVGRARAQGIEVALDDLGAGYSGLKTWSLVRPDFVKLDRHFITDIHRDGVKREFVRSISEIARGLGCRVIAEGIEREEELATLRALQVRYGQGYLLHRPEAEPRACFVGLDLAAGRPPTLARPAETVEAIMAWVPPLRPATHADQVNQLFRDNPGVNALPVVEDGIPVGIVGRRQLMERFSARYAHDLNWRKPIRLFAANNPLVVDCQTPIHEVSRRITDSDAWDMNMDFIITREGRYAGVGRTAALLKHLTTLQIRNARHSNPLTQLPGNVPIYEQIDELLGAGADFRLAYIDINDFKPFNDHYGYSLGDEVIRCLAAAVLAATHPGGDFVGHIGGDDFVVLFRGDGWRVKCEAIVEHFSRHSLALYAPEDLAAGGVPGADRRGARAGRSLLSLAVGVVNPDARACHSHHDVASLAAEAKHEAKRRGGNQVFVSERRVPARRFGDGAEERARRDLFDIGG